MEDKLKNGHKLGMKLVLYAWLIALIGLLIGILINKTIGSVITLIGISAGFIGISFYIQGNLKKGSEDDNDKWK